MSAGADLSIAEGVTVNQQNHISYLNDDSAAEAQIHEFLTFQETPTAFGFVNALCNTILFPSLCGLLIAAIGTWIFGLDRSQQVHVFSAAAVAYAVTSLKSKLDSPELHLVAGVKALVIACYRRR